MALTKTHNRMVAGSVANVLDFGADPTGTSDSTSAFNAAIATGNKVFVPKGQYSVSDITVVDGMNVEGVSPVNSTSILIVNTNNSSAFRHTSSSNALNVSISNLSIKAASGVTGAKFFLQDDKSVYLAYAKFSGIETWRELEVSYEGFFIFTSWDNCRDAYFGVAVSGQTHQFINANPDAYGQTLQTNLNQVNKCQVFNADNTDGAVDISYGVNWAFNDTDFEGLSTRAVRIRGVYNTRFESCWFEDITATDVVNIGSSPSPNPQGSYPVVFENCHGYLVNVTTRFIGVSGAYGYSVLNSSFAQVPSGVNLSNGNPDSLENVSVLSGAGSSGFLTGLTSTTTNTVISNSQLLDTVIPTPSAQQINIMPIGPSGLTASNFTVADNGTTTATLTDVASSLGLSGNALKLTMTNGGNWFYYQVPAKLTTWLRDRKITLTATGYGDGTATVSDGLLLKIWEDVTPDASNQSASSSDFINVSDATLQTTSLTYTIGSSTSNLYIGCYVGGSNSGDAVIVDLMSLLLGEQQPTITKFR